MTLEMGSTAHSRLPLIDRGKMHFLGVQGFGRCIKLKDILIACRVIGY
jgi:hypothetical protein